MKYKYVAGQRTATSLVHYTTSCNTQPSAPEDERDQRPKHVELTGIINKPLLLHLVGVYIICNKYLSSKLVLAAVIVGLSFAFVYNFRLHIDIVP